MPDVRAAPHLPDGVYGKTPARWRGRSRPSRSSGSDEQAEAEAAADLIDADLESCGADAVPAVAVAPRRIIARAAEITEDDLAEAECQADLCHVDAVA